MTTPEEQATTGGLRVVLGRLAGFTILPLLALVMPLILMPIIGGLLGATGWSDAIAGQAVGTMASVAIQWGWNVEGTVLIAQTTDERLRAEIYARSVRTRLLLAAIVMPVAAIVSALIAHPGMQGAAISMALAYALLGMSPAYYCIGVGRPGLFGAYDTVPRFVAILLAAPLLLWARDLWPFPVIMALMSAGSLAVFHRRYAPGQPWFPRDLRQTLRDLGEQRHTAGINIAGQVFAQAPTPIANATTSAQIAGPLATTDILYRLGLFSTVALGNAFQSWTLEPGIPNRRQRHLAAIGAHVVLGVAGVVVLVLLGPIVSPFISSGAAPATTILCLYYGLAFAFVSASTPLIRNLLIPAGRQPLVLRTTVQSGLIGTVAMLGAGLLGWIQGVAIGMALSQLALLLILLPPALKVLNAPAETPTPEE